MNYAILQKLGLLLRQTGHGVEADLELMNLPLVNPITRRFINQVTFVVVEENLNFRAPPELVGLDPLTVAGVQHPYQLEERLNQVFNQGIFQLQRRSTELQAIGVGPVVDPETLKLTARVQTASATFVIASDRGGNFRIVTAESDGAPLELQDNPYFELSEFTSREALGNYLISLLKDPPPVPPPGSPAPPKPEGSVPAVVAPILDGPVMWGDLLRAFGEKAVVPPASSLELLIQLKVAGEPYRFAAVRVAGRTFRGLLAGNSGRVWSDRFEVEAFPGVRELVVKVLKVPPEVVEIVGGPQGT